MTTRKILRRPHGIHLRLSGKEFRYIRRAAEEHGLTLSGFLRLRILARPARNSEIVTPQSPRREQVGA